VRALVSWIVLGADAAGFPMQGASWKAVIACLAACKAAGGAGGGERRPPTDSAIVAARCMHDDMAPAAAVAAAADGLGLRLLSLHDHAMFDLQTTVADREALPVLAVRHLLSRTAGSQLRMDMLMGDHRILKTVMAGISRSELAVIVRDFSPLPRR
jgi:hypothetical protein